MKIGKSTDVIKITSWKELKRKVSHTVSGEKFFSPTAKETLLKQLDLVTQSFKTAILLKTFSHNKALVSLNEVLLILGKTTMESGDMDVLLIEKFLSSWLKKYGEGLPDKRKKELITLKNLLVSKRIDEDMAETIKIFFSNQAEDKKEQLQWKVLIEREKSKQENGDDELKYALIISCNHLGLIRVNIGRNKKQLYCSFVCDESKSRHIIRKSLPVFRKNLLDKGMEIPVFRLSRQKFSRELKIDSGEKRINLWG